MAPAWTHRVRHGILDHMSERQRTIFWWVAMSTCGAMVVATFLTVGDAVNGWFTAAALVSMLVSAFLTRKPSSPRDTPDQPSRAPR